MKDEATKWPVVLTSAICLLLLVNQSVRGDCIEDRMERIEACAEGYEECLAGCGCEVPTAPECSYICRDNCTFAVFYSCVLVCLGPTIIIGDCNSGVANQTLDDGCIMSDFITQCTEKHQGFLRFLLCVGRLANGWKAEGLISRKEKRSIMECAATSRTLSR